MTIEDQKARDWAAYDEWWHGLTIQPEYAWRMWIRDGNRLVSPVFKNPLPLDLMVMATCSNSEHEPPEVRCKCGINVFPYPQDIAGYVDSGIGVEPVVNNITDLARTWNDWRPPPPLHGDVVTFGRIIGPVLPPCRSSDAIPKYHRLRASGYQVLSMYTDTDDALDYDCPITVNHWFGLKLLFYAIAARHGALSSVR